MCLEEDNLVAGEEGVSAPHQFRGCPLEPYPTGDTTGSYVWVKPSRIVHVNLARISGTVKGFEVRPAFTLCPPTDGGRPGIFGSTISHGVACCLY